MATASLVSPRPLATESSPVQRLHCWLAIIYLVLVLCRIPEILVLKLGTSFYILTLVWLAVLVLGLIRGTTIKAIVTPPGLFLVILTGWSLAIVPFSSWPGGSVRFLTELWSRSMLAFAVVASAVTTLQHVRMVMIGIGASIAGLVASFPFAGMQSEDGRYELSWGSLNHANALSYHMIFGLPFLLLLVYQKRSRLLQIVGAASALGAATAVLRTGSRAGLLEVGILFLIVFFRGSLTQKVLISLAIFVIGFIGLSLTSKGALERFKALNADPGDSSSEYVSAQESKDIRVATLRKSLEATFEHPLMGVGPGTFTSASSTGLKPGERPLWKDTHNAYTKASSETGLPGFAIYITAVIFCLKRSWSIMRRARATPGQTELANTAFFLLTAMVLYTVHGVFDSNTYVSYYFPVLAALTYGLTTSATTLLQQAPAPAPAAPRSAPPTNTWPLTSPGLTARPTWPSSAAVRRRRA